ncbi:MAG: radical SAM protein, partial [Spirochaetaceae bacterium]|nr:radical SAM protein [Spirochaetaceae bacterium]
MTSPETQNIQKPPLAGLPLEELTALLRDFPAYRAKQIYRWLKRAEADFNSMTDIPADFRLWLADNFSCRTSRLAESLHAADGTQKARILLADGAAIEAVLLSDGANRRTACLSTQAGCPVGCIFCKTGSLGFKRNLISAEIVEQLYILSGGAVIDNIVLMGMGEPLDNFDNLTRFLALVSHPDGLCIGQRHISVSTCGLVDKIERLTEQKPQFTLSVSLHAPNDKIRSE